MNFELSDELKTLQRTTRDFIREQIMPLENDPRQDAHRPHAALRDELVSRARAAGLLTPHASIGMGGLGLSHVAKAVMFEEAGYSWLGPTALNIHAPDEGNVHLREEGATDAQKTALAAAAHRRPPVAIKPLQTFVQLKHCFLLLPACMPYIMVRMEFATSQTKCIN